MVGPTIHWYGHDAFLLTDGQTNLWIDPFQLPASAPAADIVLISHEHYDHCSVDDFSKIAKPTTDIIAPGVCSDKLLTGRLVIVRPGDRITKQGVLIEAVPAYNIGKDFHPKADQRVGFIVTMNGQRIYHAGDTDLIPEMENLRCDIALLPISGTYVMTADEAATAANAIKPSIAIPMHYGTIIGTNQDVEIFRQKVDPNIEVRVLPKAV